jgi:drug/metabolite transporter (DMT)-like permease
LFGSVIAVIALKEPFLALRVVAAILIVCGLAFIRLQ